MDWFSKWVRGRRKSWRAMRMRGSMRRALGRERARLATELGRGVRLERATEEFARMQEQEYKRLQRLDVLYKELSHARWKRIMLLGLATLVLAGAALMSLHEPSTPFQLKGTFTSVLFRTTSDIAIRREDGAAWLRDVSRVIVDGSWEHRADGPFPTREPMDIVSLDDGSMQVSHLMIPAGTLVRLQRDGNAWSMVFRPPVSRRKELRLTLFKENGAMGTVADSTVRFADGLDLVAADADRQLLRLADLRLELPCLPVDSVRFVTTDHLHPEAPQRSSVLAATLTTTTALQLLQHDTLAVSLADPGIFCLKADQDGLSVTHTGEAVELLAGRPGVGPGLLNRRSRMLTARISAIPEDMRAFIFSVLLAVLCYFILEQRRL